MMQSYSNLKVYYLLLRSCLICIYLCVCPLSRFEATRQIRQKENEFNEKLDSGEVSLESFPNMTCWHTPILAMTADVIQATDEECRKCGMDGYVSKPFAEEQLYSAVACHFESR